MRTINIRPELVSDLYGKDIIAFGTGKVGKVAIPYISRDPKINLLGASNSRITKETKAEYLDTEILIRPLSQWYELYPNATILITILDKDYKEEAKAICAAAGFKEILFLSYPFLCAISYAFINNLDQYLDVSYPLCKDFVATTSSPMLEAACLANEIRDLHTVTFAEFKGCNRGKDVVVVGCGPTLNYYTPIPGAKHIGVNSAYKKEDLELDYLFISDYENEDYGNGNKFWFEELEQFHFQKFFAQYISEILEGELLIPENVLERNHARRYVVSEQNSKIYRDIEFYPLMYFRSTIFAAIQFALYTRPKRIFLVGCDCFGTDHFDSKVDCRNNEHIPYWIAGYKHVKNFVQSNFADTEIISINPVGLKGLFHDVYTESYLSAHPEIDRTTCEILDSSFLKQEDLSQK